MAFSGPFHLFATFLSDKEKGKLGCGWEHTPVMVRGWNGCEGDPAVTSVTHPSDWQDQLGWLG